MTHPLSARLVLLAAAAALAASLIFAIVVAEHRDVDGRPGTGAARAPEVRDGPGAALDAASAGGPQTLRTAGR